MYIDKVKSKIQNLEAYKFFENIFLHVRIQALTEMFNITCIQKDNNFFKEIKKM